MKVIASHIKVEPWVALYLSIVVAGGSTKLTRGEEKKPDVPGDPPEKPKNFAFASDMYTVFKTLQRSNALVPMLVTDSGIFIDLKL